MRDSGIDQKCLIFYSINYTLILRPQKNEPQLGAHFLINLAVSDLLKTLLIIPMNIISSFKGKWLFGQTGMDNQSNYFRKTIL